MTQPLPRRVTIVEVGPRDGLQNEAAIVPTSAKIAFVDALSAAGHSAIEVAAFVSPKWVPQMADAAAVLAGLTRHANVRYSALVPNLAGLTRAVAAGVRHIAIFAAASETFSKRNINQSVDESLETYRGVIAAAHERRIPVRGYLSTCFGCPFEGRVPPQRVAEVAGRLFDLGVWQVALSDTIGVAHPAQVTEVLDAATRRVPLPALALHMHDTRGTALANVLAGLQYGVTTFDSAAGGLGGCPYAPGASGNLATEDLLYMLHGMGIETGVSLDGVLAASRGLAPAIGHPLPSKYFQAAGG
jgi:isopropylmalate/homocitrate/citramalate synthase